jgi:predicted dehydrogenase
MASTRRHFLRTSASSLSAGAALARSAPRSANERIQFATIGSGGMGSGDTHSAAGVAGTKLMAVCDVYQGRLARAREVWGPDLAVTRDYREILGRQDIDAVIIATPDHWHAALAVEAMEAGKDVYVEKPMVQKWEDGRKLVETAQRTGRILQVGSQRVSSVIYKKAQDLYRAGAIGELNMVEAWWDRNSALGAWQYSIPPDASPRSVDWERFLGSAPNRPFEPVRLFRWRNYQDYGTGVAGDLFVHLFSGLHFITGAIGPTRVFAGGGLRFWKDGRDVPDILLGLYDYPKTEAHPAFNLALRVNFANGAGETSGFHFVGSDGVMSVGAGVTIGRQPKETDPGMTIGTFPRALQAQIVKAHRARYPPLEATLRNMIPTHEERYLAPRNYSDHADHFANWFGAIRTRKPVVEDALFGLRAAGPAVLSNLSYARGKPLEWDPVKAAAKA